MSEVEIILTLLLVVAALVALAGRLRVPYPIFLVLGGAALGFLPQLPNIAIDPETVLVYATISGLHYVSMGALTHSAPALDLSLILETSP